MFRRLSHHRHPYKEVALNCTRRYGDVVTFFAMQNKECHQLRLKPYSYIQKYQTQLCICRSTTSLCQGFCVVCVYLHMNRD